MEYEEICINPAGYWISFHEAALDLHQEILEDEKDEEDMNYNFCASLAI